MSIELEDIVIVETGKHRGFVGFVDEEAGDGHVVLYDLTPNSIKNGFIVVPESSLRKLTQDEIDQLPKVH